MQVRSHRNLTYLISLLCEVTLLTIFFPTQALPPAGIGSLGQVVQAANSRNFQSAVLRADSIGCGSNSIDTALSRQYLQNVWYVNPSVCNIIDVKKTDPASADKLTGTGVLSSPQFGMANAQLVKSSRNNINNRRMILTNAHAFQDRNKRMARMDKDGKLLNGSFKFYLEACHKEYEVTHVKIGGANFNTQSKNDFAVAVLKEPVCEAAESSEMEPPTSREIDSFMKRGSVTLATRYLPGDVCQKDPKNPGKFAATSTAVGGAADTKPYISNGELVGFGDESDPYVEMNTDIIPGGSGGSLFSNFKSASPRLIGIGIGGATVMDRNGAVLIHPRMVEVLKDVAVNAR